MYSLISSIIITGLNTIRFIKKLPPISSINGDLMGRVKTQLIKRLTMRIMSEHKGEFKKTFEENKAIVDKLADWPGKKLRNSVTGYVTRLAKKEE
jgi:ribosomal protein S17E